MFSFFILSRIFLSLSKDNGLFPPLPPSRIEFPSNLPISLSPTSVTFSSDCCYHQKFNPKPSYFHHLVGGKGWQQYTRRHPQTRMQNGPLFIIDRSYTRGASQEGVFHKCSNIYTPHTKTAPYQGMLNRYAPSRETPQHWGACPCPSDP